jgi:GWxTD domain-containing protein
MITIGPMKVTLFILTLISFSFQHPSSSLSSPEQQRVLRRDLPVISTGQLDFSVDYAGYQIEERKIFEEFYLKIPYTQLQFAPVEDGYGASVEITLEIYEERDSEPVSIWKDRWKNAVTLADTSRAALEKLYLCDLNGTVLVPGEYSAVAGIKELNSGKYGRAYLEFQTPEALESGALGLSDIHFSHEIQIAKKDNFLNKGNYLVIPNTLRTYTKTNPYIYIYQEIYNLSSPQPSDTIFPTISYTVLDRDGTPLKEYGAKEIRGAGDVTTEMGVINIVSLPQGDYILKTEVYDPVKETGVASKRMFRFIDTRTAKPALPSSATGDPLLKRLTDDEVDGYEKYLKYILTPSELTRFNRLNTTGKRRYVEEFWKGRDPDTTTVTNERLREHLARYATVEKTYGKNGWKTDRGRIFIKYGKPDDIERESFPLEEKSYEIWYYRKDRVMFFRFEDTGGPGEYELADSSERSEIGVIKRSFIDN